MEYKLNGSDIVVSLQEVHIDTVVGESAKMDVVKAVNYIQSGKAEIEAGVTEVLNQVDDHVADKTAEFDLNASNKTGDFNTNASNKTTDFNDNYTAKKALIDAEVGVAQTAATNASNSANLSKQWAIGDPTEPSEGSAKYWATQSAIAASYVAYGTSDTAGNVAEKEVLIPEITELKTGQILYIKPSASATVADLTIKLNNFTAYPIRYNNSAITTSTDDLVWNQNYVSQFVFDGTYWQFAGRGYDKDTTYTQNILFDRGNFVSGSGTYAISRYSLCLQKPDMTWEKVTNTEDDYSLATDKTVNTHGFLLNGEMLYYSNTAVLANGAASSANTMYRQNSGFDIRYSMNTTGTGYTAGDYIYLVGAIGVDGLFYLDSTQWWTNTLPSTNDGKIYVKIGKYVSGVTITLELEHPAYYHDGTKIRVYGGGGGGGAVDSVNGQTGTVVLTASDVGALATSDVTEYTAAEVETLWGSI